MRANEARLEQTERTRRGSLEEQQAPLHGRGKCRSVALDRDIPEQHDSRAYRRRFQRERRSTPRDVMQQQHQEWAVGPPPLAARWTSRRGRAEATTRAPQARQTRPPPIVYCCPEQSPATARMAQTQILCQPKRDGAAGGLAPSERMERPQRWRGIRSHEQGESAARAPRMRSEGQARSRK